jgi:hypothetical protein
VTSLARFGFPATSLAFDLAAFEICGKPSDDGLSVDACARHEDGAHAMQAAATVRRSPRSEAATTEPGFFRTLPNGHRRVRRLGSSVRPHVAAASRGMHPTSEEILMKQRTDERIAPPA